MASLNLGAASLINESWVVFGSSLRSRISFRNKRFRRLAEKWRFHVQQLSGNEQMTKQELARSAKRSESLTQILKQYGISVESPEVNMISRRLDDLDCKEKHDAAVPSSVIDDSEMNKTEEVPDLDRQEKHGDTVNITEDVSGPNHHNITENDAVPSSGLDDSKMNTTVELPGLRRQEKYRETVSTTEDVSGKYHHSLTHLKTGALLTSLLPSLGFCIICITGTIHTMISQKTSRGHPKNGSRRTRWRTALSDLNEKLTSYEHDTSPEHKVSSAYHEATDKVDEVDEACSKIELEYTRFLLECGLSES